MISLKSKVTQAVLGYLALHEGQEFYGGEMARYLSLDTGNLARKLIELKEEGILQCREKGKERYYAVNPSFPLWKEYKKIVLKTVGLEHQLREALGEVEGLREAYLFGSYAKDRMDLMSDIDMVVVGRHNTLDLQKKISEIQKHLDREINLISLSPEEYETRKKTDPFLKSVLHGPKIQIR